MTNFRIQTSYEEIVSSENLSNKLEQLKNSGHEIIRVIILEE